MLAGVTANVLGQMVRPHETTLANWAAELSVSKENFLIYKFQSIRFVTFVVYTFFSPVCVRL